MEFNLKYKRKKLFIHIINFTLLFLLNSQNVFPNNKDDTSTGKDIILRGLNHSNRENILSIIENSGSPLNPDYKSAREKLIDLDIFASVQYRVTDEKVYFYFKELPASLVFPAMKKTDQNGLLMGPGVSNLNFLGLGIKQMLLSRFTVHPDPGRSKEILYYLNVPQIYNLPFQAEFTSNYFDSYNSLKLYNEKSLYNQINMKYFYRPFLQLELTGTELIVKRDSSNLLFPKNSNIEMFLGDGDYDNVPSIGLNHIIDLRNRIYNTQRGFYLKTGASIYGKKLHGEGNYSLFLADIRTYYDFLPGEILHFNLLGRYRPGTIPGYELYHIGGINSLRSVTPDPDIYGQHELLYTFEYRHEFFSNRQISLLGMKGYYGLQLVIGNDHAHYWRPEDDFKAARHLSSLYFGFHILVPALERIRLEMGFSTFNIEEKTFSFGISWGWFEKSLNQGERIR